MLWILACLIPCVLSAVDNSAYLADDIIGGSLNASVGGDVYSCGSNDGGQLGDGTTKDSYIPRLVTVLRNKYPAILAAGEKHSMSLGVDGSVKIWGYNSKGQLGLGPLWGLNALYPTTVAQLTGRITTAISASGSSSVSVEEDGIAFVWGNNDVGQLGLGADLSKSQSVNEPTLVPFTSNNKLASVRVGSGHALGISTTGVVYAWGKNNYGQLGIDITVLLTTVPTLVPTLKNKVALLLAVGATHSVATTVGGVLYAWGSNEYGQLCTGDWDGRELPTIVFPAGVVSIATGNDHTLFLTSNGTIFSCGRNDAGQLGVGDLVPRNSPTPVYINTTAIYCDTLNTLNVAKAIQDDVCVGSSITHASPKHTWKFEPFKVVCGEQHSILLLKDGNVFTWGLNEQGQLCLGHPSEVGNKVSTPKMMVQIYSKNTTSIAAGGRHTLIRCSREGLYVTGIHPKQGPMSGGTPIYVIGQGFNIFRGSMFMRFSKGNMSVSTPLELFSTFRINTTSPNLNSIFLPQNYTSDDIIGEWNLTVYINGALYPTPTQLVFSFFGLPGLNYSFPRGGPINGGSRTVIHGRDFRFDASQPRCLFGELDERNLFSVDATVISPTELVCISPAYYYQTKVQLRVTMNGEDYSDDALQYSYYKHPTLSNTAAPASIMNLLGLPPKPGVIYGGPIDGGTLINVVGSGFSYGPSDDAVILMGGSYAKVLLFTNILLQFYSAPLSPAIAATVTNGTYIANITVLLNGQDASPGYLQFAYYQSPKVTSFTPRGVPVGSTSLIHLVGIGFESYQWYPSCSFGGIPTKAYITSATTAECPYTNGPLGLNSLQFSLNAQDFVNASIPFNTYLSPSMDIQVPRGGPLSGGTHVIINGTNFLAHKEKVLCRYKEASEPFTVNNFNLSSDYFERGIFSETFYDWATPGTALSDTQLRCITLPLHFIGNSSGVFPALYLSVSLNGFDWTVKNYTRFQYYKQPYIEKLDVMGGPNLGRTIVTIWGTGFYNYNESVYCRFGSNSVFYDSIFGLTQPTTNVLSAAQPFGTDRNLDVMLCVSPPIDDVYAIVLVSLTLNGQDFKNSSDSVFTYFENPSLFSVNPYGAPTDGGYLVRIFGSGFERFNHPGYIFCKFGNVVVPGSCNVVNYIDCRTPVHEAMVVLIEISLNRQQFTTGSNMGFRFYLMPVIDSIFPRGGRFAREFDGRNKSQETTEVILSGTGFFGHDEKTRCLFGALDVPATPLSNTKMRCLAPPDMTFVCEECLVLDIFIEISLNGQDFTSNSGRRFRFFEHPSLPLISPRGGPKGGTTVITVKGASGEDLGFQRFNDGNITFKFGSQLVLCEMERGPIILTDDFDPLPDQATPETIKNFVGDTRVWNKFDGVVSSPQCGSSTHGALLFTGFSQDIVHGRIIRSKPIDLARGGYFEFLLKRGNMNVPDLCEIPDETNELFIKTTAHLDDRIRATFLQYYSETNFTRGGLLTGTTLSQILNMTSNSTDRTVWQLLIDLEQNETVSWNTVAEFNVTNYETFTPVLSRTFRDQMQIACPWNTPCQTAKQEMSLEQPRHANGPFDIWVIDDIKVSAAGGIADDSAIYCLVPSVSATDPTYSVPVSVAFNSQQYKSIENGGWFTYYDQPTLLSITPDGGPTIGSTTVTITGDGLDIFYDERIGIFCKFGKTPVVATRNGNKILCTSPPTLFDDLIFVQVTLNGQDYTNSTKTRFLYFNNPEITNIYPSLGPSTGGTRLMVNGTGFSPIANTVTPLCIFYDMDDNSTEITTLAYVHNDTLIECLTPNVTAWFKNDEFSIDSMLQVTLDRRTRTTWETSFVFFPMKSPLEFSPSFGTNTEPKPISITGNLFRNDTSLVCVWFSEVAPSLLAKGSALFVDQSTIMCIPPSFPGQKILQSNFAYVTYSPNGVDHSDFIPLPYLYSTPESYSAQIGKYSGVGIACLVFLLLLNYLRIKYNQSRDSYVTTDGDWLKPSLRKAFENQTDACPRKYGSQLFPLWETSAEEMGQFGIGLGLYFQYLKYMMFLFVIMSFVASINILLNQTGNAYQLQSISAMSTSHVGNLLSKSATATATEDNSCVVSGFTVKIQEVALIQALVDIFVCFIFIVGALRLRLVQNRVIDEINKDTIDASAFTAYVAYVPWDATNPEEWKMFFQKYGEVADVAVGVNNSKLIQLLAKKIKLEEELEIQQAKLKFTKLKSDEKKRDGQMKKLAKLNKSMKKILRAHKNQAVAVFVTYNHIQDTQMCLYEHKDTWTNRVFVKKSKLFRGQYRVATLPAMPAMNIYWENLQFKDFPQFRARSVTTMIAALLLMGSFTIILFTRGLQKSITVDSSAYACLSAPSVTDPLAKQKILWSKYIGSDGATNFNAYIECYCKTMLTQEPEFCYDYVMTSIRRVALTVASVLGVVVINALLKNVLKGLAKTEYHHTITSEERAITVKIFAAQFMNTAMVQLVVNTELDYYFSALVTLRDMNILTGEYRDFTSEWYNVIGSALAITVLTNAFTPNLQVIMQYPIQIAKRIFMRNNVYTQRQLNTLFEGPVYMLSERYGILLNMLFTSMLYSSGMPVLLWFMVIFFALAFWCDKIALLRVFKKPARYDEQLALLTNSLMPLAVVLHLAFSVWMLGAISDEEWNPPIVTLIPFTLITDRLKTKHAAILFYAFLFFLFGVLIDAFFGSLIKRFFNNLLLSDEAQLDKNQEITVTYLEALENQELSGLESYHIKKNPRYKNVDLEKLQTDLEAERDSDEEVGVNAEVEEVEEDGY